MWRWMMVQILGLAVFMGVGLAAPTPDPEYRQGIQAFERGEFVRAANHFYKSLQGRPGEVEVMAWYASALLRAGERDKALLVYRQIVALAPKSKAADQARQILEQASGSPGPASLAGKGSPVPAPDAKLWAAYGQVLKETKALDGYHTQVLALERGVMAAPGDVENVKSLLAVAYNPRDGTITAVGIGRGADAQQGIAAATIDATRWLSYLSEWRAGKFNMRFGEKMGIQNRPLPGLAKVVAKEKLGTGWVAVVMEAKVAK